MISAQNHQPLLNGNKMQRLLFFILSLVIATTLCAQTVELSDSIVKVGGARYYIHKVGAKQTLYSISKRYETTVDVIKSLNQLSADGLTLNQYLKIPVKGAGVVNPSTPTKPGAATTTVIPVVPVETEFAVSTKDHVFNIVVLIPLHLNEAAALAFSKEKELPQVSSIKAFQFIGLLEGVLMAVDSLKKQGFEITVSVLNETEDSMQTKKYLTQPEMKFVDLIIGPFYNPSVPTAARIVAKHNAENTRKQFLILPMLNNPDLLKNNPFIIKPTPSVRWQITRLSEFVKTDSSINNYVLLLRKEINEQKHGKLFKHELLKDSAKVNFSLKDITWESTNANIWNTFRNQLKPGVINNVLMFSNNEAFISTVIRKFMVEYKTDSLTLFGLPTWQNFESLETEMLHKLNLTYFSTSYINYFSPATKTFIKNFISKYNFFPDKYAFQGFDLVWMLCKPDNNTIRVMPEINTHISGYYTDYLFVKEEQGGVENSYVNILKYANYNTVRLNP